jgi:hypothetical protein
MPSCAKAEQLRETLLPGATNSLVWVQSEESPEPARQMAESIGPLVSSGKKFPANSLLIPCSTARNPDYVRNGLVLKELGQDLEIPCKFPANSLLRSKNCGIWA